MLNIFCLLIDVDETGDWCRDANRMTSLTLGQPLGQLKLLTTGAPSIVLSELRCVLAQTVGLTRTANMKTAEMSSVFICVLSCFINIGKHFHRCNKRLQRLQKIFNILVCFLCQCLLY